jgi:hypothetical protein
MDKLETVTEEQKKFAIDAIVTLVVDEISLETGENSMTILPKFIASKTAETLYDESSKNQALKPMPFEFSCKND